MTILKLFNVLNCEDKANNPFETAKSDKLFNAFIQHNINKEVCEDESAQALADIINNERSTAFEIGYKTAISLVMQGIQQPDIIIN